MLKRQNTWVQTLLVCLLFLALGITQAVSLSPQHQHDHGDAHSCDICHSGHISVVVSTDGSQVRPDIASVWRYTASPNSRIHAAPRFCQTSRGPPTQVG